MSTPALDDDPFQLGLTLYSASAEFRADWYDFEGLLDRVAELGIGPGIEIVASQVLPTYPVVSDDFVRTWRSAFDKHGFAPSSFGANLDMGRRRDRDMTPDEEFEFSATLFDGAVKLGFPLIRIQSAKPELLRRLLPLAERSNVKLAYEIHAPMGPNAPEIMKVREVYDQLDSPLLGFVADFSSTMRRMSPTLLRAVRRAGLDDEAVERLQQIWATDLPMRQRQEEFIGYLHGRDFDPSRLGSFAHLAFNMHGHVDVQEWADIMPQILHVHAKFYDIDENGEEPAIDYPELVRVFVAAMAERMKSIKVGHALHSGTDIGPVVSQAQLDQDLKYIDIGQSEGARLVSGGGLVTCDTEGYYLAPTLFADSEAAMRISREEIFGPVANVVRVADYEAALAMANDTEFGLSAGIATTSLKYANHFKRHSQAGMVMVNLPTAGVDYHVPFGGRKGSSYGSREQGRYAQEFYTVVKTSYIGPQWQQQIITRKKNN